MFRFPDLETRKNTIPIAFGYVNDTICDTAFGCRIPNWETANRPPIKGFSITWFLQTPIFWCTVALQLQPFAGMGLGQKMIQVKMQNSTNMLQGMLRTLIARLGAFRPFAQWQARWPACLLAITLKIIASITKCFFPPISRNCGGQGLLWVIIQGNDLPNRLVRRVGFGIVGWGYAINPSPWRVVQVDGLGDSAKSSLV